MAQDIFSSLSCVPLLNFVISIASIIPHLSLILDVGWHQKQPDSAGGLDMQSRETGGLHQDLQVCGVLTCLSSHSVMQHKSYDKKFLA